MEQGRDSKYSFEKWYEFKIIKMFLLRIIFELRSAFFSPATFIQMVNL